MLAFALILRQRRHLMFDASESAGDANDDDALPNIEGIVMSPHELRRVGDAFGASGHNYGEQVWVLTAPYEYNKHYFCMFYQIVMFTS